MALIKKLLVCFLAIIIFSQLSFCGAEEQKLYSKTITYSPDLQADLFSMPSSKELPAVILVHGGSWCSGSRKELSDFAAKLAQSGFLAMTIDYHLLPEYNQQQQTKDVINAIFWLRENSKQLRVNPCKIGVVGISAGGYLAAWTATHDEVLNGIHSLPNAVVSLYGPWNLTKEAEKEITPGLIKLVENFCGEQNREMASPLYFISKTTPPILIVHGDADKIVPVSQSISAYKRLKRFNCKCKLVIVHNDGHCFPGTKSYFSAIDISIKFLSKVLK